MQKQIMKKNLIYVAGMLFLASACSDFEEININPNNPSTVPANLLLPTVISVSASSVEGSELGAAGQFVQHMNYIGGYNESFGRFNITGASFREEWNGPMRNIKDVNQIISIAEANNQPWYKAIGLIWKVYTLSLMTDAYGDIPYDEAGKGDVNGLEFPHYQSQEEVYSLMIEDLKEANGILASLSGSETVDDDILYNGDLNKWRKFANSLMLRILMRESNKIDVSSQVAEIFNNSGEYPLFQSSDDQAVLVYNNTSDFYYWYIQPENRPDDGSGVTFGDNYRVSEAMVDSLAVRNDPRLPVYAAPTKNSFDRNKENPSEPLEYRGQPAGLSALQQSRIDKDDYSVPSSIIRSESRSFLMTYTEIMLLKAEAIVRGMITGDAAAVFADAVRASLEKWPAIAQDDIDAFMARPDMVLASDENTALAQIWTQAWIDSYLNGFEAFANWRRTGYPKLYVSETVSSNIPVRYIYSDNEQNNPNLISWTTEHYGRMVNENDMVWFQPQRWNNQR